MNIIRRPIVRPGIEQRYYMRGERSYWHNMIQEQRTPVESPVYTAINMLYTPFSVSLTHWYKVAIEFVSHREIQRQYFRANIILLMCT